MDDLFATGDLGDQGRQGEHRVPGEGTRGSYGAGAEAAHEAPLAARMRPRSLDELVGQEHLIGPGSPLRRLADGADGPAGPASVILWGPPGSGKTTLAHVVAGTGQRRFVELSAVTAGVKDVRRVMDDARAFRDRHGGALQGTVLFLDEIHRFTKAQQDALLPGVENRWVILIAATTENPSFSVVSPLLSRSLLLTLRPLDDAAIEALLRRAAADERGLAGAARISDEAMAHLVRLSDGDARRALTTLEAAAGSALARAEADGVQNLHDHGGVVVELADAERALDRAAVRYDRAADQHYDVTSALIKSVRGSDVDAALHYLARMLEAGEDARFIARRLVIAASEEIAMADPTALQTAVAAAQAVQLIGMPEGRIILAQAVVHLAMAPKSNASYMALNAAVADVRAGLGGPVPPGLRDGHYAGAKRLGHAQGYRYAHDDPRGVVQQQYAPDDIAGRDYYAPTERGAERGMPERLSRLRAVLRGGEPLETRGSRDKVTTTGSVNGFDERIDEGHHMSVGGLAALIAAIGFVLLVGALAYPLFKLGKVLDETRHTVRGLSDGALPLLAEVTTTVSATNQQLGKVDTITDNVASMSTNVSALTSLFAATLGSPVVKVAAFSYGVRSALSGRKSRGKG